MEVQIERETAPSAGPAEVQSAATRAQGATEGLSGRDLLDTGPTAARFQAHATPREGPAPGGRGESSAPLLIEFGARDQPLAARLLERREELETKVDGQAEPGRRDRAPSRSRGVSGRAENDPAEPPDDVRTFDTELVGASVRPDREAGREAHDLGRKGVVGARRT